MQSMSVVFTCYPEIPAATEWVLFSRQFIPLPSSVKLFSNLLKVFLKSLRLMRENDQNNNPFVENVSQ